MFFFLFFGDLTGQQQIIKVVANGSGQPLKAISKHAIRSADGAKLVGQVNEKKNLYIYPGSCICIQKNIWHQHQQQQQHQQ